MGNCDELEKTMLSHAKAQRTPRQNDQFHQVAFVFSARNMTFYRFINWQASSRRLEYERERRK